MRTSTLLSTSSKAPWTFFGLVFLLAVPFWVLGPLVEHFLPRERPINLPISALQFVCPMIAASLLVYRECGTPGVKQLFRRSFDERRISAKIWYVPIFLLPPLLLLVEYGALKLLGRAVPVPQFPLWLVPVFFVVFFITALCEELGWSGYATDPLQDRWTALGAGLIMGIVWAVWHAVPNTQVPHHPLWLVGQFGNTVMLRVLIVWLYNNTGKSVFAAIVFHDMVNVSEFLFPIYGSYYDPFLLFLITTLAVALIAILWGPKTLARYRFAR